ncbi:MAG: DNA-3-methyladenine glycosylase family protein [Microbacterium gubbeenense]
MCNAEGMIRDIELSYAKPCDVDGVFAWMTPRAIAGVENASDASFSRAIRLGGGPAWFRIRRDRGLILDVETANPGDVDGLIALVRRVFDLDTDGSMVDAALSAIPEVSPLVESVPGIRVPGAADPFEMLIRAMVGQQISVAAARTHLSRLAEEVGERAMLAGRERILFPTAAAIAARGSEVLRGPAARVRAIVGAAEAVVSGELVIDGSVSRDALLALPGVGPWTADYLRMRVARDADLVLTGDLALRAGAAAVGIPSDPRTLGEWAGRAAPWRSYLSAHLWRQALVAPKGDRG